MLKMKKRISSKERKFIEDFIRLYFRRREVELVLIKDKKNSKIKERLIRLNQKNKRYLLKYSLIFDTEFKIVSTLFNKIAKREENRFYC